MKDDTFIKTIDYGVKGHDFTKTGREFRKGIWKFLIRKNCGSGCCGCDNCTEEIKRWPEMKGE